MAWFRRHPVLLAAMVAALSLLGISSWLLGTSGGARWAVSAVSRWTSMRIEAGRIAGRIAGDLLAEDVEVRWPGGLAKAGLLHLRWHPLALFEGSLAVEELTIRAMEVREEQGPEKEPEGPGRLEWPTISGLPVMLRGKIDNLLLEGLVYHPGGGEAIEIHKVTAGVTWRRGILSLERLRLDLPAAAIAGNAAAGFVLPSLKASLEMDLAGEEPAFKHLSLSLDLGPAPRGGILAGDLRASSEPSSQRMSPLNLVADLESRATVLAVHRFEVSRPGRQGTVSGSGEIDFSGGKFLAHLQATVRNLDLSLEADFPSDIGGTLEFTGNADHYTGTINLANRGAGWREMRLSTPFSGDGGGVVLPKLEGSLLGGTLQGRLDLGWKEEWVLKGSLRGRKLDPSRISPDWPGQINLNLSGNFRQKENLPLEGKIEGKLLASTLRGRALTGEVQARLREGDFRLARASLHGDGFDLTASGSLQERLDFQADIRRLSGLVPGTKGQLKAGGWTRWRDGWPAGSLTGRGHDISFRNWQIGTLELAAGSDGPGGSFSLKLQARDFAHDSIELDAVDLQAGGTWAEHEIRLDVRWPQGELLAAVAGGYAQGVWRGKIADLAGHAAEIGRWHLEAPVRLTLSAVHLKLSLAVLTSVEDERLLVAADLDRNPLVGRIHIEWNKIRLAHANPWLGEVNLSGTSTGRADIHWLKGDRLKLDGNLEAGGKVIYRENEIQVDKILAEIHGDEKGLKAHGEIQAPGKGTFTGRISSARPFSLGFPESGEMALDCSGLDLSLFEPWLPGVKVTGRGSFDAKARWEPKSPLEMVAEMTLSGRLARAGVELVIDRAATELNWTGKGLSARVNMELGEGGTLAGSLSSPVAPRLEMPERGDFQLALKDIDLTRLQPFLPPTLLLGGVLSGEVKGHLLPKHRLDLEGSTWIAGGSIKWRNEGGLVSAELRNARLDCSWREEVLSGDLSLAFSEVGQVHGDFKLPLPARLPTSILAAGPVRLNLTGELRETGLIAALFPGMVEEARGQVSLDIHAAGTWQEPDYSGSLRLAKAGAYLPAAGIRLQNLETLARFSHDRLQVESFQVDSGSGRLKGSGVVDFDGWRMTGYRASIRGEQFQAVNLPELQMEVSPDLAIEGTRQRLKVRGKVLVPSLLATASKTKAPVQSSPDVVIVSRSEPEQREIPLALDIQVRIVLGDHVLVKMYGVDARLGGDVTVEATDPEEVTAKGKIEVLEGAYAAYGVKLKITRGSILFAGGPVDRPTLDVLAVRKVQDVTAGVRVTGTPRQPSVALYSEPAMPDTDTLAYIVLGHPMGAGGAQSGLLMAAATGLLSRGDSETLQEKLKGRLGLDVLTVESGGENAEQSVITVGKYLSPDLYVSIGQSLFTGTQEARLRYDLSKNWQVESRMGTESGVDLYYKIEFD